MKKSLFTAEYHVLANLLREQREAAGLTQVDMATRLDETQSYVSKCERGDRRFDLVQLQRFCRAMGVKLAVFAQEYERRTAHSRKP